MGMSEWREFMACLKGHSRVVLLVHEKPDGDCLGSALALGLVLADLGFEPELLLPEKVPALYTFLPGQQLIKIEQPGPLPAGIPVIIVDCGEINRLVYRIPPENIIVNIDHHISNSFFGHLNIVDTGAAAAAEIVYRLLLEGGIAITPEMAACLYVAISTDTGSFTYSNTTSETFKIAGDLLNYISDMDLIRTNLYEKRPLGELMTVKAALENLIISQDGKIMSCSLSYREMELYNLFGSDTDGLVGMMRATDGVELAILFKELQPGEIKVSLRSKSYVDANKLAQEFGGGGHPRAAGCTIKGCLEEARHNVLARAADYVGEGEGAGGRHY